MTSDEKVFDWSRFNAWDGKSTVSLNLPHRSRSDAFVNIEGKRGYFAWRAFGHGVCCIAKGAGDPLARDKAVARIEKEWRLAMVARGWPWRVEGA